MSDEPNPSTGSGHGPDPHAPDPCVPDPAVPEPSVPDADVPAPSAPDPSLPDTDVPEPSTPDAYAPDEDALRLAEALVFASAAPVTARALSQLLPENADADAVIAALRARYAGRGVELAEAGGGVMFRTAEDLAPRLRKVVQIPRRLPRVAMETLAIIAYHQPVTRAEIEEIRGTSLAQQTLEALMEAGLIMLKGRRETPGRPAIWGTTPQFLAQFGLNELRDLPRREDLLLELPIPTAAAVASPDAAEAAEHEAAAESQEEPPGEDATDAPEDAASNPDRS
jgi:segregation and condensation protein B